MAGSSLARWFSSHGYQGNMLHSFVSDQGMIFEDRAWIWERYGTAYRALPSKALMIWA